MRKIFIAVAALTAVLGLRAEGYQVNTLSTRQTGMGHVGTAMKLGAESQLFNPGALAFSDNTFELTGSVTAISAHATATHQGVDYKTDNDLSTPFSVTSSWRILDRFYGGVAFYTPYGSSINWGEHWPGAVLNQKVGIRMFTVQPTLSYRILPNLSIGAGLMLSWGSVDLYKGLLAGESLNRLMGAVGMPPEAMYAPGTTPASVNLKGSTG
ncbi:MAG: outer membrane protein transport protein, partial [Muribaculaceae bacterium]|nr:outer membrane protein transport protein [Muribaculaceae bacterium]